MRTLAMLLLSTTIAQAQFAAPVQPNTSNYGDGRIDASEVYHYIGQRVTACGMAAQNNPNDPSLVMGVSPYETIILFPPGTDPGVGEQFSGHIICATGRAAEPPGFVLGARAAIYAEHIGGAQPLPQRSSGPCINPNGTISGRAPYGGGPVRQPFPPCQ